MRTRRRWLQDERWLPFWMPFFIFAVTLGTIFGGGFLLLNIALATHDMIAAVPKSGGVIIAALVMSLLIGGLAAFFAQRGGSTPPSAPHHHERPARH